MHRIVMFLLSAALWAQTPTADQSLSMKTGGSPRISPDGRLIAYTVTEADWEENAFRTQIWIYDSTTGERYQLTHAKKSSSSPQWSPDSKKLAFSSSRDGKTQIYLISPTGGEATPLTDFDGNAGAFQWSPDGKKIAFVSSGPPSKARKEREEKFGAFEVFRGDHNMNHIWTVEVATPPAKAKPTPLTGGAEFSVGELAWSPDSQRIAFSAARDPDIASSGTSDIYIVRLSDKGLRKVVSVDGPDTSPVWSPDGAQIAFQTANGDPYYFFTNRRIGIAPADGGPVRVVSGKFDENASLIDWGPEGIYFSGFQKTTQHLFRLNPATGDFQKLSAPAEGLFGSASFTRDFAKAAFTCSFPNRMAEICTSTLAGFAARPITSFAEQLKPFQLATRDVVEWKSKDGALIEGILIKPHDFDPSKKYPLLVIIHGGPAGIDLPAVNPDRTYPIERFAAKGAVILRPNYRGSAGYGEKFRSLNVRNLGLGDHDDVVSGVDFLIAKGYIDPERVGAMGWSQGGYISAFLTTFSTRFKAISVGAGISDWRTYYVNTDIDPFTRQYLKATPWEDPEIYRKTSPMSYINNAKTPTLIQHGEFDKRVPIPNAYELYRGLQDRNVPVKLIVYKGFGHGVDKPKEQKAAMEHNYDWFSRWIWGEKVNTLTH
ncbi:MAG: S9 family peptidase [Bryobacteraceae bacterium]|nr:S9 family peptidase [Bryobacteraceae bacterium]